jgi:hypothetical protein
MSAIPFERKKSIQAPVIELSDSFNKKNENKRREKDENDDLQLYSLRRSMSRVAAKRRKRETSRTSTR